MFGTTSDLIGYLLIPSMNLSISSAPQSIFNNITNESAQVITIWWILFGMCLSVFIALVIFLFFALTKSSKNESKESSEDKSLYRSLYGSSVFIIILLISLLVSSHINSPRQKTPEGPIISIKVTGLLYWWRFEYLNEKGEVLFETANEFSIPKDTNIKLILKSDDVIHSFWLPSVGGKVDLIPGHTNHLYFKAKQLGRFRGQCAEFCGIQHAKMSFYVDVVNKEEFHQYIENQSKPARVLVNKNYQHGQRVFHQAGCIDCHRVKGKWSLPQLSPVRQLKVEGPDLTHFKSRKTLASASFSNSTGHLAGWIADPQSLKPGNLMPASDINSKDFKELLKFLEALK